MELSGLPLPGLAMIKTTGDGRSDGVPTYLTPDVAYQWNKYRRGYEHLIDIWGPGSPRLHRQDECC